MGHAACEQCWARWAETFSEHCIAERSVVVRCLGAMCKHRINEVNCPRHDCVGMGYLGYDTVMCFMCEHQWSPEGACGEPIPDLDAEQIMGIGVKKCPNCGEYIEKNGGCDHMTCRCRHQFYWTTLKPYPAPAPTPAPAPAPAPPPAPTPVPAPAPP
mmetsp:Transcript_152628/g.489446  ORF Transcript_152628/g.489446 Transcript_152628/m.489446 type:complete len:157 (+) Transcript_152628:725-1195(+)